MNRSVTLSARGVLVALIAALALMVAYLLGNGGGTAQAAPQSPAATDSSARSAAVVHRGQHLPGAGGDAAIGAASGGGLGISRSPGRRPGRASRSGPRGSPFHGLDGVEDART